MSNATATASQLALTAKWIAAVRGSEHLRDDGLLHDPWAVALAGEEGRKWLAERAGAPGLTLIAIRGRFFDDFLQRVVNEDSIRQIVLLGAGLDTRAFRLSWPAGTRIFELDQPEVLEAKDDVLRAAGAQPTCARQAIAADLTRSWAESLSRAGFDRDRASCWLLEGFLFYLRNEDIERVLGQVTELAAPGSRAAFDIVNGVTLKHPLTRPWLEMQAKLGAPWLGSMDDPVAVLAARGWKAELSQAGEKNANYGRWPYPVIPRELPDMPRSWFVTARKN